MSKRNRFRLFPEIDKDTARIIVIIGLKFTKISRDYEVKTDYQ